MDDLDTVADKKYLEAYALAADFMNTYNKLPEVGLLSDADRDNVEKLEKILGEMTDYQKSFLSDDYIEGAEEYIQRMKNITPADDDDDEGKKPGSDGSDEE